MKMVGRIGSHSNEGRERDSEIERERERMRMSSKNETNQIEREIRSCLDKLDESVRSDG